MQQCCGEQCLLKQNWYLSISQQYEWVHPVAAIQCGKMQRLETLCYWVWSQYVWLLYIIKGKKSIHRVSTLKMEKQTYVICLFLNLILLACGRKLNAMSQRQEHIKKQIGKLLTHSSVSFSLLPQVCNAFKFKRFIKRNTKVLLFQSCEGWSILTSSSSVIRRLHFCLLE